MWNDITTEKTFDKAIEEATKHIKSEYKDDLVKMVKTVLADKLKMYQGERSA